MQYVILEKAKSYYRTRRGKLEKVAEYQNKFNLSYINKKYFPTLSPTDINGGNCFNWAYIVHKLYPSSKLLSVDLYGGHTFVKLGNLLYDAEHTTGVKDVTKIIPNFKKLKNKNIDFLIDNKWIDTFSSDEEFLRKWKILGK